MPPTGTSGLKAGEDVSTGEKQACRSMEQASAMSFDGWRGRS